MRRLVVPALVVLALCLAGCSTLVLDVQEQGPVEPKPSIRATATSEPTVVPPTVTPAPTNTLVPTATPAPITVGGKGEVVDGLVAIIDAWSLDQPPLEIDGVARPLRVSYHAPDANVTLAVEPLSVAAADGVETLMQRFHAVVVPFATVRDDIALDELRALWRGEGEQTLLVCESTAVELAELWGEPSVTPIGDGELAPALAHNPEAIGIVPFDMLDPTYKVLTVDEANVLSNQLDPTNYPLAVAVTVRGEHAKAVSEKLAPLFAETTNRDPERLTQLVMTGVTAMCRLTAERMEQHGVLYPALVISDTLRAADITHVSNEVPFIAGCEVDTRSGNLVFCSDYDYWDALDAVSADIVGLSGNHVNDFGYDGARESITFYRDRGIPIYGSGLNVEEACAPIELNDHGNTFAFVAALAWNPASAWATGELPGTCYYYDHKARVLDTIRALKMQGVDVVAVELQYLETYNAFPTAQQIDEFRELREAGADIVTGVQSHVPQAWEPYAAEGSRGPGIIVYGLGNFFFDQMWSWETRTALIARHTVYNGRLISSEVLTTVLEDAAQPRWATADEREEILTRIFGAFEESPWY